MAYRPYEISLNSRKYMVDTTKPYGRVSVTLQRPQADTSPTVGEQSLNPEDLWRRSLESWHRGAGQEVYDRSDSDPYRFDDSLGVNPWEKYELSLLGETENKRSSTAANVRLAVAGSRLYCGDNQTLAYTTSVSGAGAASWTTVTGTPAATISGLCSDGFNVYSAHGASGIYKTTRDGSSASAFHGLTCEVLDHVKGRLMAANDGSIYNITSSESSPNVAYQDLPTSTHSKMTATGSSVSSLELSTEQTSGGRTPRVQEGVLDWGGTHTVEEDDFVVAAIVTGSPSVTITPPAGWNLLSHETGTVFSLSVYGFQVVADGDAGGVWTFSASVNAVGSLALYKDCHPSTPVTAIESGTASSGTAVARPEIEVANSDSLVVFVGGINTTTTFTPPSGMTERRDINLASCGALEIADVAANAGTLATANATAAASGSAMAGTALVLEKNRPTALFTHDNTDWQWVGFADGLNDIYAAGYSGDKSLIYKTQVRPDGTALTVPSVAGALPDGEIVRSIYGYLGFVFVGTDKGVRMAQSDPNGDLIFGSLIPTPAPVRAFEGQDRFVWYGLENFDVSRWASGTYDGLGRLDLSQLVAPLTPARASDLMVTGSTSTTEQVQSIVTFGGKRVFTVADSGASLSRGVYAEKATKVSTGYLDSGLISYGLSDAKVATYLDLRHQALTGTVQAFVAANEGTFTSVGTSSTASSTKPSAAFSVSSLRGENHEVRLKLDRADSSDQVGPVVTRATLRSEPAPARSKAYKFTVRLFEELEDANGQAVACNPKTEVDALFALMDSQTLVTFEDRGDSRQVFIRDVEFQAEKPTADGTFWQGWATITAKEPAA